jgi:hypothetical protein
MTAVGQPESEFVTAREAARLVGGYSEAAFHDPRTRDRLGLRAYRIGHTRSLRFRRADVLALLKPDPDRA